MHDELPHRQMQLNARELPSLEKGLRLMATQSDKTPCSRPTTSVLTTLFVLGIGLGLPGLIPPLGAVSTGAPTAAGAVQNPRAYQEYTAPNNAIHQEIRWVAQDGSNGIGLFLLRVTETGLTQQLFVKTPGGRHLILEKTLQASSGLDRTRLIDDETGWWFEVTKNYGFTAAGLRKFFSAAEDFVEGSGKEVKYTLQARDGSRWETSIPAQQPQEEYAELVKALQGTTIGTVLEHHLKTDLADAILFLARGPKSERLGAAAGVLVALRPSTSAEATSWHEEVESMQPGLEPSDPEMVKLRAEFVTPLKSLWDVPLGEPASPSGR